MVGRQRGATAWGRRAGCLARLAGVELTHVDASGAARMVDVSAKQVSVREASASGMFRTTTEVVALLRSDGLPKGDALAVARIAGIAAAKRTPDLVPLCHPVAIHGVTVELELGADCVRHHRHGAHRGPDRCRDGGADLGGDGWFGLVRHGESRGPFSGADRRPA